MPKKEEPELTPEEQIKRFKEAALASPTRKKSSRKVSGLLLVHPRRISAEKVVSHKADVSQPRQRDL